MRALAVVLTLLALPVPAGAWGRTFRLTTIIRTSAPQVPVAAFSFRTPGCYPSGSLAASNGQTLTVVRADAKYCPIAAGEQVCQANEACVTEDGLLVEQAGMSKINYYPTPTAPSGGTTAISSLLGHYEFWVEGVGSQTISAGGTLIASGLPCTASPGSPCGFTITSPGAAPSITRSAPVGSLTRGQIEYGYKSSFMPLYNTPRAAETLSVSNPVAAIANLSGRWCIQALVRPESDSPWAELAAGSLFVQEYTTRNNAISAYFYPTTFMFSARDKNGVTFTMNPAHGLAGTGTSHRFGVGKREGFGMLSLDGSMLAISSGVIDQSPIPLTVYIGTQYSSGNSAGAHIKDFTAWASDCR